MERRPQITEQKSLLVETACRGPPCYKECNLVVIEKPRLCHGVDFGD